MKLNIFSQKKQIGLKVINSTSRQIYELKTNNFLNLFMFNKISKDFCTVKHPETYIYYLGKAYL